jgi:molybdopterin/thiamine biosynthesis adenylyltransferase
MVPVGADCYQFFQGNTRRSRVYRIERRLAQAVMRLDGMHTLSDAAALAGADLHRLYKLVTVLHEACLVESAAVAKCVEVSPWRRVLNFLGDYFPSDELENAFARLGTAHIAILGVGGVGSWVAYQLAQSGIKNFTLIDADIVARSNLNRSLFGSEDIGRQKVEVLAERLQNIAPNINVAGITEEICEPHRLHAILSDLSSRSIVVNSADMPSVDATSTIVDEACQSAGIPYIIAGGYNLHLSLIGITVIPGQSACYHCTKIGLEELQGNELEGIRKLHRPWRNIGNLGPLTAITASLTTVEVVRLALAGDRIQPAMLNRRGEFNFLTSEIHFTDLPPRPECGCVGGPELEQ